MKKRRLRPRRWLVGLLLLPLALEAVYVVAANGFLASDWGQARMNRRPDRFSIRYERARSWLPGRVEVDGLELGGGSRRSTWRTVVDRGRFRVSLPALVRREFRVVDATAVGGEIEVDLLPRPEGERPQRKPGSGWLVSLENIEAEPVRLLRIGDHRIEGEGRLSGGARFQARGPTAIDLEELSWVDARFVEGGRVRAEDMDLTARVAIAPFDAIEDELEDVLARTTTTIRLEALAEELGFLEAYLGEVPWLEIGGRGHLEADVEISRGWLAPHSRIALEGPTVFAEYFGLEARGAGRVRGGVAADGTHVTIDVELDDYSLVRPEDGARLLTGQGLELHLRNDSTAIDRPASGVELAIEMPAAEIPDLSAFAGYLPPATGLRLTGGKGRLEAGLTYRARERRGEGWLKLVAPRAEAVYQDVDVRTALTVDGRLAEARLEDGVFDISGSHLYLGGTEVRREGRVVEEGWWGRVDIPRGTFLREIGRADADPAEIDARIAARLRDSGPIVALISDRVGRLGWLDRVLSVEDVVASTGIRTRGERLSLAGLEVVGGERAGLEIRGELDLESKNPQGVFFARWGRLSAAVEIAPERRRWHLTRPRRWYEERAAAHRQGE